MSYCISFLSLNIIVTLTYARALRFPSPHIKQPKKNTIITVANSNSIADGETEK